MGWWASQQQEEAGTRPLPAHLCLCDGRLAVQSLSKKPRGPSRGGWEKGLVFVFHRGWNLSSWRLPGCVWVLWKQLEETAGCLRENG